MGKSLWNPPDFILECLLAWSCAGHHRFSEFVSAGSNVLVRHSFGTGPIQPLVVAIFCPLFHDSPWTLAKGYVTVSSLWFSIPRWLIITLTNCEFLHLSLCIPFRNFAIYPLSKVIIKFTSRTSELSSNQIRFAVTWTYKNEDPKLIRVEGEGQGWENRYDRKLGSGGLQKLMAHENKFAKHHDIF